MTFSLVNITFVQYNFSFSFTGLKMIGKGFLQQVSKKQFWTLYRNVNTCG